MLPLLIPRATQGRNALAWGLVCSPWGREGLGLAGLQLRGAQGGGNQRQPCGPRFHLPASKRCKQTLSLCQAAAAPSLRPQPALPSSLLLLPGKSAATHLRAPQRGSDSWPLASQEERGGPARRREGRSWDPRTSPCSHCGPGWELETDASRPSALSRALSRARYPVGGHVWLLSTRYVASPKGDVPQVLLQTQHEQKHVKHLVQHFYSDYMLK